MTKRNIYHQIFSKLFLQLIYISQTYFPKCVFSPNISNSLINISFSTLETCFIKMSFLQWYLKRKKNVSMQDWKLLNFQIKNKTAWVYAKIYWFHALILKNIVRGSNSEGARIDEWNCFKSDTKRGGKTGYSMRMRKGKRNERKGKKVLDTFSVFAMISTVERN